MRALPLLLLPLPALAQPALPFALGRPDARVELPRELIEVSALTDMDERTVACVQDEQATLYLIDAATGSIIARRPFGGPADLEGLTRVGGEMHALRSDGLIYRMRLDAGAARADTFRLGLPHRDLEGLGYDERRGLVLVCPKSVLKGSPAQRDLREVHAYDAATGRLLPEPVLRLSLRGILGQARALGLEVPIRTTPKGRTVPALRLRFSSVAVDPIGDRYYLLSAADRTLLVVDRAGRLEALRLLDPALFPKPEGITFLPSGTLLISNEGEGPRPATLLRFERKP